MRLPITVACLVPLLTACRAVQSDPVPVSGTTASLAGEWRGSYESPQTGRAGSILFTLAAGEDHAHGDVVMVPRGRSAPLRPADAGTSGGPADLARSLSIEFVRAAGDSVFGTMAPYTDPDCDCTAITAFTGRIEGDMIRGTFTVRRARDSRTATGTWSVQRAR